PTPPPPPPPGGGDWVGVSGADGYALGAWNRTSDEVNMPYATVNFVEGLRHRWESDTAETQAVEAADESHRRAAAWYDSDALEIDLTFTSDYTGQVHLYALDWDSDTRRQIVTVDDGSGPQTVLLNQAFDGGAWMSFDVAVTSGETVSIAVTNNGGANAVLSAITLGGAVPAT
ncbi:MAG: hypothetical protein ACR2OH_00605, partial [Microthrixaceae bacterium]